MGSYERLKDGGDLAYLNNNAPAVDEILTIRQRFPLGFGLSLENQGALAWECGDDEAAKDAFEAADQIESIRGQIS